MLRSTLLRKRNLLILLLSLILLTTGVIVFISGHQFTQRLYLYGVDGKPDPSQISVTIQNSEVVSLDDAWIEKEEDIYLIKCRFNSQGAGVTPVSITYPLSDGDITETYIELHVNTLGFMYEAYSISFSAAEIIFPSILLCAVVMLGFFLYSFLQKLRAGAFSYSMVALGGGILYLFISILIAGIEGFRYGIEIYLNFYATVQTVLASGYLFLYITFPVLLFLAAAVSFSNIWLVRHEGLRPVNVLGAAVGLLGIACTVGLFFMNGQMNFSGDPNGEAYMQFKLFSLLNTVIAYVISYLDCMLMSTIFCSILSTRFKVPHDRDYLIILGCCIRDDGSPTPLLRGRIDRALAFEREQFQATGKHACFVPSGGQGSDECISEAESMKRYLTEHGVPESQILMENKSVNTFQNMAFSKKVIASHAGDTDKVKIGFATTNYHVFRGYTLSKKLGMKAYGLSAKTKLYFFPNAFVREFIGLLFEEKWHHIFFIVMLTAFFSSLSLIVN